MTDIVEQSESRNTPSEQYPSAWRKRYAVHPAADVFPMMSDAELEELGEDIKTHGLNNPIVLSTDDYGADWLVDGRNRLEAMERAGIIDRLDRRSEAYACGDAVSHVISLNIRRRHLTKQQQADLIVAAVRACRQDGEVPKQRHVEGKAGSEKDAEKAKAVETAAEHGISKRTVERSIAKAKGKTPRKRRTKEQIEKDNQERRRQVAESWSFAGGIEVTRMAYLAAYRELSVKAQDKEWATLREAMREITRERLETQEARRKAKGARHCTKPKDDLDLPACLDRRRP
jgi:hypothetical protein